MVRNRTTLSKQLHTLVSNCYYQPPASVSLKYPCIVYSRQGEKTRRADDDIYNNFIRYTLTYIDTKPDSPVVDKIARSFRFCSFDRVFISDNLYHYTYTLFY